MTVLFNAKPMIIAEIGSNFKNFQEAKDSIAFAKMSGADAVKFQLFTKKDLFGVEADYIIDYEMSLDWIPKLKEKADACGIELMCSAFSPELYDFVNQYVEVHKIASSELTYPQILEKVKSFGKPILLSVGGSNKGDIEQAMKILRGGPQVVLMYCVGAYPSVQYNLFAMQDLKETFSVPVGLSDHSPCVSYPALSATHHFGAVAIEKHVNFTKECTPDSGHSLSHNEFTFMCEMLRGKRDCRSFNPMPEERDMFLRHNRRLIATKDIQPGEPFKFGDNYGCYRSLKDDAKGIIGFAWEEVERSSGAKQFVKAGDGISAEDFL